MPAPIIAVTSALLYFLLWGVFTRRWSAESRIARAAERRQSANGVSQFLLGVPVPWMFILVYFVGLGLQFLAPLRISWSGAASIARWCGPLLVGCGLMLAVSALALFKRASTTTVPFGTPSQLMTRGPYRFTRNPMYLGLTLAYLGIAIAQIQPWPLLVMPLLLVYINVAVIPVEERRLHEVFGEDYARYRSLVRRWF